jgi:methylated-DNA-[protein]-cysteine S-methyltransferase
MDKPTLDPHIQHALDALYANEAPEALLRAALANARAALGARLPPTVYYDETHTALLGALWVAVTDHGVVAIDWELSEDDFKAHIAKKIRDAKLVRGHASVDMAVAILNAYLNEDLPALDLPVDERMLTGFQRRVLHAAAAIPRGQYATYGEIAAAIGSPKAFQAVGQALRHNPIPILLPCHRVIPAASPSGERTLGGYGGKLGDPRKVKLLKLEGVMLA